MPLKCFFAEPTNDADRFLRRYHSSGEAAGDDCPGLMGYHNAETLIGRFPVMLGEPAESGTSTRRYELTPEASEYRNDARWPTHCECGYAFTIADSFQVVTRRIYISKQRPGEEFTLKYPRVPGMIWDAWWMPEEWRGPDGRSLIAVTPDGWEWNIDGPCSNCTRKGEPHKCWCRHGEPPELTVDKTPNPKETTCSAGGGSIQTPKWHGFLRDGFFVE